MKRGAAWFLVIAVTVGPAPARAASQEQKVEGYAEWRKGDVLVVDGQRIRPAARAKFKGNDGARNFASIPLGYEVKAKGVRLSDGTLLAHELEAKPNGKALFEGDLREAFDEMEGNFRRRGRMYEEDDDGDYEEYGRLQESGPDVARVRAITQELIPSYLDPEDFRVYVVENKEWNAMAAPNGSIYVFTGLIDAMDDDELAIILGHELAHATHEHSRKQFKKDMVIQLAALGVIVAADTIDSKTKRAVLQVGTLLVASAWRNGYGRGHEDQADRVGLRYAYEAGYDVSKGPRLWQRFADRYGNLPGVLNFFLSDHSQSKARSVNLQRELALNYSR